MNEFDFSFEQSPWETFLLSKTMGDTISAAQLLTILESAEEQEVEDALQDLETGCMQLDISDLPRPGGVGEAAARLRQEVQLVKKGMHPEELEDGDPLRLYLEELAQIAPEGDAQQLAEKCAAGNTRAMEYLTNLGLNRVVELACEYVGYGVLLLDLIQEGSMGLWHSVQNFRSGDYPAFRDRWIRFYMAKAVTLQARTGGVGQKMRTALEDYRAVDERLLGELGRNPTLEEIAEELHMSVEEVGVVRKMLEDARLMSQVHKPEKEEEETPEEEDLAVEDTALFQSRQRIADLLSGLDQKDQKLLALRFGLEGGKPLTPEETGKLLGMTAQEVVAREGAALTKLRNG